LKKAPAHAVSDIVTAPGPHFSSGSTKCHRDISEIENLRGVSLVERVYI